MKVAANKLGFGLNVFETSPFPYQLLQTSQGKRGGGGVEAGVVTGIGQSVTEMGKSN